eukprot:369756_1
MCMSKVRNLIVLIIIIHNSSTSSNKHDVLYKLVSHFGSWSDDEYYCEQRFGTTLATIIDKTDMNVVFDTFNKSVSSGDITFTPNDSIWIGLYTDISMNGSWKWITQSCNYSLGCIENPNWHFNQPNGQPVVSSTLKQYAARLVVNNSMSLPQLYDYPSDANLNDANQPWFLLCNDPNSKYKPPNCTNGLKCWKNQDTLDNYNLTNDIINASHSSTNSVYDFRSPVAYWNNKLFVIGENQIHYSSVTLFHHEYKWHNIVYNKQKFKSWKLAQRYAQYQSYLYLYSFHFVNDNLKSPKDYLITINLNTLQVLNHSVPWNSSIWNGMFVVASCVVANQNSVYIITYDTIMVFTIISKSWNKLIIKKRTSPLSCFIDNNDRYIYVIYNHFIVKYLIDSENSFQSYDITNVDLCDVDSSVFITSIVAPNGKTYIQGCDVEPWETLIFNPSIDKFETETIDIFYPTVTHMPYYRSSQFVVFNVFDNVLLLLTQTDAKYPIHNISEKIFSYNMHVAITDLISINFMNTIVEHSAHIWPSDGFIIKYNVTDFTNSNTAGDYNIAFVNNNPNIKTYMKLNIVNDNCTCNQSIYLYCYYCYKYFNLSMHLSTNDNNVQQLLFEPTTANYIDDIMMLPNCIPITLQRCNISLQYTKNKYPSITFGFNLSSNCYNYSRIG